MFYIFLRFFTIFTNFQFKLCIKKVRDITKMPTTSNFLSKIVFYVKDPNKLSTKKRVLNTQKKILKIHITVKSSHFSHRSEFKM